MSDVRHTPAWPDDVFYIPVASADSDDPKAPDTSALPGTWSPDGTGCINHGDLTDRRWGIVDVDAPGYRLLIIDLDIYKLEGDQKQRVVNGLEKAPNTRIHESQSGGKHVFYWIREDELDDDETLPVKLAENIDDKLNGYVLSTHCGGYDVTNDVEPAEISIQDIPDEWIKQEEDGSPDADGPIEQPEYPDHRSSKDVGVYDIITRKRHPPHERVPHPYHGSETGSNFMVDANGQTWRCWRHGVTGDALHLFGVGEGIIRCGEWDGSGLSAEKNKELLDAAEDAGLIEPTDFTPAERAAAVATLDARSHFDAIEDVDFPEDVHFSLDKPPREGGSYAMADYFTDKPQDLLVLSSRHHILKAHTETVAALVDSNDCAVHLEGKQRVCDNSGEGACPNRPDGFEEMSRWVDQIWDVLHRKRSVTAADCPDGLCPHWFLRQAAKYAEVVVTVPQLFHSVVELRSGDDSDEVTPVGQMNLMLDEEQTVGFFWPGSVDIADIGREFETDGAVRIVQETANIKQQSHVLQDVMDDVEEAQESRKEQAEEEGRDWQRKSGEILIEESLAAAEQIMESVATTGIREQLIEDGRDPSLPNAIDIIEDRLEDVTFPDSNAQAETLLGGILEHCAPYFWREEEDPSSTLESMAFPYEEQSFDFKRTSRNSYTLRLIGDRERDPFYADELAEFNQIGVIAGPEGERFLDSLPTRAEPASITIDEFRYDDDFIVMPMRKDIDDEGTPEAVGKQRNRVEGVAKKLNERNLPQISVTGTRDQAAGLSKSMTKESSDVVGDPESPTATLYKLWSAGQTAIIYENSVVSRGIDAPIFDVTTITSPGFATPYWEAKKRRWKGEDDEKYRDALAREKGLKAREVTNAALRMSTTRDYEGMMGSKFIVVAYSDASSLKYLQQRSMEPFDSVKEVADIIENLSVRGGQDITIRNIREGVGGSEHDLMAVLLDELIEETGRDRPSYTIDEVEEWVSSGSIPEPSVVERLWGEGESVEDMRSMPALGEGQAAVAAAILARKGDDLSE